jgi:hypothetical protein
MRVHDPPGGTGEQEREIVSQGAGSPIRQGRGRGAARGLDRGRFIGASVYAHKVRPAGPLSPPRSQGHADFVAASATGYGCSALRPGVGAAIAECLNDRTGAETVSSYADRDRPDALHCGRSGRRGEGQQRVGSSSSAARSADLRPAFDGNKHGKILNDSIGECAFSNRRRAMTAVPSRPAIRAAICCMHRRPVLADCCPDAVPIPDLPASGSFGAR